MQQSQATHYHLQNLPVVALLSGRWMHQKSAAHQQRLVRHSACLTCTDTKLVCGFQVAKHIETAVHQSDTKKNFTLGTGALLSGG